MLIEYDLGHLGIESAVLGLQIRLSSVAKLAPSEEDEFVEIEKRLTTCKLNSNSFHRPWIYRGSNLRLVLSLRIDGVFDAPEERLLSATLSAQLRSAKLWGQLHLSPSSVEASCDITGHHRIAVFLEHADTGAEQPKRKLHNLGADVPFYDTKPPVGVYSAALEAVHMDLHVARCPRRKQRRFRRRDSNTILSGTVDVDDSMILTSSTIAHKPALPNHEECVFELDSAIALGAQHDASDVLLETDYEDILDEDVGMLLEFCGEAPLDSPISSSSVPPLLKRTSSATDLNVEDHNASKAAILELVDVAVRLAISGSSTRSAKGILVTRDESFERLADLAPSVWSPAYLPAVASRAAFLPTIGHAIEYVCCAHAVSQRLRHKGADLNRYASRSFDQLNTSNNTAGHHPAATSQDKLATMLWRRLQSAMYDDKAARRLEPLYMKVEKATEEYELQDEILDSSHENDQSGLPGDFEANDNGDEEDLFDQDSGTDEDLFDYTKDDYDYGSPLWHSEMNEPFCHTRCVCGHPRITGEPDSMPRPLKLAISVADLMRSGDERHDSR